MVHEGNSFHLLKVRTTGFNWRLQANALMQICRRPFKVVTKLDRLPMTIGFFPAAGNARLSSQVADTPHRAGASSTSSSVKPSNDGLSSYRIRARMRASIESLLSDEAGALR